MSDELTKGTPTRHAHYAYGKRIHPASPEEHERAKAAEKERQKWDPSYITAEQASRITPEVAATNPELAARVQYSAPSWPENSLAMSQSLGAAGTLPGGEGETVSEGRSIDPADIFTGRRVGEEPTG